MPVTLAFRKLGLLDFAASQKRRRRKKGKRKQKDIKLDPRRASTEHPQRGLQLRTLEIWKESLTWSKPAS